MTQLPRKASSWTLGLRSSRCSRASFCVSSGLAFSPRQPPVQPTANSRARAAIACVTGAGVQVKAASRQSGAGMPESFRSRQSRCPSNPPVVTYVNGKLAIVAKNSTLSDILRVVGDKTGAVNRRARRSRGTSGQPTRSGTRPRGDCFAAEWIALQLRNDRQRNDANSVAHVILTAKSDSKPSPTGAPADAKRTDSRRLPAVRATAHTVAAGCDAALPGIAGAAAGSGSEHTFVPACVRRE